MGNLNLLNTSSVSVFGNKRLIKIDTVRYVDRSMRDG